MHAKDIQTHRHTCDDYRMLQGSTHQGINSYNATLQCTKPGQVDISQMTQEWVY